MFASRLAAATILVALAAPATVQTRVHDAPPQVSIAVWSFGFAPQPIHLTAGKSVTLAFTNRSGSSHDFTAKSFFANATVTAGLAPDGEIELGPHQSKSITLIPRAGIYPAHCSHFFHKQLGMHDQIIVD